MLTAREIEKLITMGRVGSSARIVIDPFDPAQINPNSYDVRLSGWISRYTDPELDARRRPEFERVEVDPDDGVVLRPGELYLGCTEEYTESHGLIPMINGKSSLARLGISVHQTGGFGDLGFRGNWTLEISVIRPVRVYAGIRVAQICWFYPAGSTEVTYRGRYRNRSRIPVPSRFHEDFGRTR